MDDDTKTTEPAAPQPAPAIPLSKVITPEKKAFLAALAKAQGAYKPIEKNQTANIRPRDADKTPYSFKYADLDAILDGTREALSANGLSTRVLLTDHDGDTAWLNSIVAHSDGWEDVSSLRINTVADDIKQFGGRISFIRRYLLGPQLGVAATDDIDKDGADAGEDHGIGDVARGAKVANAPKPTPARKSAPPNGAPPAQRQAAQSGPPEDPPPPDGFTTPAKPSEAAQAPPGPTNAEIEAASIEAQFRAHGSKLVDPEPPAPQPPPAPPPPAPAPPAQSAAKPSGNSAPCTPGEILYIAKRIRSCGIAIRPTLDEMGATDIPDDLTGLTKAQWTALLKVTSP